MYSWVSNRSPPLRIINFSIFFHSGHSYSNPSPINYWGKFPTQTNFLKQYNYASFFAISQKEWPVCTVFCFVSSWKEATNTLGFVFEVSIKKLTYHQLLTTFSRSTRMLVNVILLNVFLNLIDELDVFFWSFESFIVDLLFSGFILSVLFYFVPT